MKPTSLCFDSSDLSVHGQIDSLHGQVIFADVVKCSKEDGVECESDEKIKNFFANQTMFILSNQISFDFQQYG